MEINWMLILPILVLQFILVIVAMIDLLRQEDMPSKNKIIWALVIILFNTIGPIIYFVFGRRNQ